MSIDIWISKLLSLDVWLFFMMVIIFIVSRYFLHVDIENKSHKHPRKEVHRKQNIFFYSLILVVSCLYFVSLFYQIEGIRNILQFSFTVFSLYIVTLIIHRKILLVYGEEVEVSGQNYFKKWYKVSLFSLFINIIAVFVAIFFCIKIFELDTLVEIGGLWAGILAFMWFTAPVWALDMIAGIIMLQSKNLETGNVFYIYEKKLYVWIKSISLTEVKCIDLRTGNPIMIRPSHFRNLSLKNLSQGINGKSSKIVRELDIQIEYKEDFEKIQELCYTAFDKMHADRLLSEESNYFGEEAFRSLEISSFGNYSVNYKLFYSITSPFYIFKAERLLNEYLLEQQKESGIFFATPDLLSLTNKKTLV